ncbi:MAG: photosynthetic complex putative assembly protein PuhB [Gammaproteobacteria bacterium]
MNEHEGEPIRGLPELPPAGEQILWQGEPQWGLLARRVFHVRKVAAYFAAIVLFQVGSGVASGTPLSEIVQGSSWVAALGLAGIGILTLLAWLYARTTVYTLTSHRVVLRFGVALPMIVNIPWSRIASADLVRFRDGSGEIALTPAPGERLSYMLLWPHARPWRFTPVQPTLRGLQDPETVAARIANAVRTSSAEAAAEGRFGQAAAGLS